MLKSDNLDDKFELGPKFWQNHANMKSEFDMSVVFIVGATVVDGDK